MMIHSLTADTVSSGPEQYLVILELDLILGVIRLNKVNAKD